MTYSDARKQVTREFLTYDRPWPYPEILPMKRSNKSGWPTFGSIFRVERDTSPTKFVLRSEGADSAVVAEFDSIDALLEAGWVVD